MEIISHVFVHGEDFEIKHLRQLSTFIILILIINLLHQKKNLLNNWFSFFLFFHKQDSIAFLQINVSKKKKKKKKKKKIDSIYQGC